MALKTFSTNYLAIEFGVDRATATRMLQTVEPDGTERDQPRYTTATFARALELHHAAANAANNNSAPGGSESATAALTMARVRITNATAEAKERANLLAAGLLTPIADVADAMGGAIEVLRENLFAVPARVTEQIKAHTPDDSRAIYKIVELSIYDQMREVTKAATEFMAGLAAAAARGENYKVEINPLNLGHADGD